MMRKMALGLALATASVLLATGCEPPRVFRNCDEVRTVYAGGIARPGYRQIGPPLKKTPYVNQALYDANRARDADNDGIGCEVT